jgi:hypothetical protein
VADSLVPRALDAAGFGQIQIDTSHCTVSFVARATAAAR